MLRPAILADHAKFSMVRGIRSLDRTFASFMNDLLMQNEHRAEWIEATVTVRPGQRNRAAEKDFVLFLHVHAALLHIRVVYVYCFML